MLERDIKFRVWDEANKEIVSVRELRWEQGTLKLKEIDTDSYIHFPLEKDTCALSQYAGFKDKKGVEVYEGDIVFVSNGRNSFRAEVIFDQSSFQWLLRRLPSGRISYLRVYKLKVVVVDNIWNNVWKEYLKGEKGETDQIVSNGRS